MTLKQAKKSWEEGVFSRIYLFAGEEKFLINQYLEVVKGKALTGSFDEFNLFEFKNENTEGARGGSTVSLDDVEMAVQQLPQMSDRVLVIVKYSRHLEANEKQIARILENVPSETVLIFVEESIKKISKALMAIIQKNGEVLEFNRQGKSDLVKWAGMQFAKRGKQAEDLAWLVGACDRDMYMLYNTVEKLVYATEGEVVTLDTIRELVPVSGEYKIYDMADKLIGGDAVEVYKLLEDFKRNKEQPIAVLTLLFGQLHSILMIKELKEEGYASPADFLAPNMKWLAGKLAGVAGRMDRGRLVSAMDLCAKYDEEIKGGMMDGWAAVEIVVADFLIHNSQFIISEVGD